MPPRRQITGTAHETMPSSPERHHTSAITSRFPACRHQRIFRAQPALDECHHGPRIFRTQIPGYELPGVVVAFSAVTLGYGGAYGGGIDCLPGTWLAQRARGISAFLSGGRDDHYHPLDRPGACR